MHVEYGLDLKEMMPMLKRRNTLDPPNAQEQSHNNQIETLVERPLAIPIRAHPTNCQNDRYQQRHRDRAESVWCKITPPTQAATPTNNRNKKRLRQWGIGAVFCAVYGCGKQWSTNSLADFHTVKLGESL
jgi:hypothetical protein